MTLRTSFLFIVAAAMALGAAADFNGDWAIAVENNPSGRVFWLSVRGAGTGNIQGHFVGGAGGGVDALLEARIENGELRFAVERWVGRGAGRYFARTVTRARRVGEELHGVTDRNGRELCWKGRRAPPIPENDDGAWREAEPVVLFDGGSLSSWHTLKPGREEDWFVRDGWLRNAKHAVLLVSNETFWNVKLHAEYRLPPGSNSGLGLRGRYEVQILEDHGRLPRKQGHGAIYSRIAPSINAGRPPNEWQSLDVTLIGTEVSVVLNGARVIDHQQIEGFTAMATDANYGQPGPITIQGDHGVIEFRRIVVTPLER